MTLIPDYYSDIAQGMRLESIGIRRDFAVHRPMAGGNREALVRAFLRGHLPGRFGVESGLLIDSENYFSKQADLLVVDSLNSAPFYSQHPERIWPVEAAYALFEIKTNLSPSELSDSIDKCQRFKRLRRNFLHGSAGQRTEDSLFVLWSFDGPSPATTKENITAALREVPDCERPDLIIVLNQGIVGRSGAYRALAVLGAPTSQHRANLLKTVGPDLSPLTMEPMDLFHFGENALGAWFIWFDSWLRFAGPRLFDSLKYLPPEKAWGNRL